MRWPAKRAVPGFAVVAALALTGCGGESASEEALDGYDSALNSLAEGLKQGLTKEPSPCPDAGPYLGAAREAAEGLGSDLDKTVSALRDAVIRQSRRDAPEIAKAIDDTRRQIGREVVSSAVELLEQGYDSDCEDVIRRRFAEFEVGATSAENDLRLALGLPPLRPP